MFSIGIFVTPLLGDASDSDILGPLIAGAGSGGNVIDWPEPTFVFASDESASNTFVADATLAGMAGVDCVGNARVTVPVVLSDNETLLCDRVVGVFLTIAIGDRDFKGANSNSSLGSDTGSSISVDCANVTVCWILVGFGLTISGVRFLATAFAFLLGSERISEAPDSFKDIRTGALEFSCGSGVWLSANTTDGIVFGWPKGNGGTTRISIASVGLATAKLGLELSVFAFVAGAFGLAATEFNALDCDCVPSLGTPTKTRPLARCGWMSAIRGGASRATVALDDSGSLFCVASGNGKAIASAEADDAIGKLGGNKSGDEVSIVELVLNGIESELATGLGSDKAG
jgi:hypothetical protein